MSGCEGRTSRVVRGNGWRESRGIEGNKGK